LRAITIINIKPNQKFGMERPRNDRTMLALSAKVPRLMAAYTPKGIEIMIETKIDAQASTIVAGIFSTKLSNTGRPDTLDTPRSPWIKSSI
jgi:hypothetical protein